MYTTRVSIPKAIGDFIINQTGCQVSPWLQSHKRPAGIYNWIFLETNPVRYSEVGKGKPGMEKTQDHIDLARRKQMSCFPVFKVRQLGTGNGSLETRRIWPETIHRI